MAGNFVTPGEKVGTEEEFSPGENTFSDNGIIYSMVAGRVSESNGSVSIEPAARSIKKIDRDMLVVGVVTDDMKNVMFVRLENMSSKGKDFLALKDGKILAPKPRPQHFGGRGDDRGGGRFRRGGSETPEKPCGLGDTILARVLYNDKDSYTLSLNGPETGVIHAACAQCGASMDRKDGSILECKECGYIARKKLSEYFGKPEEVNNLLFT